MSNKPGRPVDEEGKPYFPAMTEGDDDVQGHRMEPEKDAEQDDEDGQPHIAT